MSATSEAIALPRARTRRTRRSSALLTLARRRAMLTSRTPRQIAVPLVGPAMLALILAPALKKATGGLHSHIDYTSFVGVGAIGLVIPLSCVFAGLSVLVDRHTGAQLALLHYGFVDPSGRGLHEIWGLSNVTLEAWLSIAVVALFAAALTALSMRVFSRSAVA